MAGLTTEDLRRQFYAHVRRDPAKRWWWVRAVYVDPNELIVDDDEGGCLSMAWTVEGGSFKFGQPQRKQLQYVAASDGNVLAQLGDSGARLSAAFDRPEHAVNTKAARDMSDIDVALPGDASRAERIRRKRERVEAAAKAARPRRDYTPSDADERLFGYEDDDRYDPDWLTPRERERAEQARIQARQAQRRSGSSIVGRAPQAAPRKPQAGRITSAQGSSVVLQPPKQKPAGDYGLLGRRPKPFGRS